MKVIKTDKYYLNRGETVYFYSDSEIYIEGDRDRRVLIKGGMFLKGVRLIKSDTPITIMVIPEGVQVWT